LVWAFAEAALARGAARRAAAARGLPPPP